MSGKKRLSLQDVVDQKQLRLYQNSMHQKEARSNLINEQRGLVATTSTALASSDDAQKELEAKKKPAFRFGKIKYDIPGILNARKSENANDKRGTVTGGMVKALATIQPQQSVTQVEPTVSIVCSVEIPNETATIAPVEPGVLISARIKEDTTYFKNLSVTTIAKLTNSREKWSEISQANQERISENGLRKIDKVIRKTNSLITKKFVLFFGLMDDFENPTGERIISFGDLQCFWDILYFQVVEKLNKKYKKLDEIMANDWVELISPVKRFTPKKKGFKLVKPSTNVRANKTQEARLRLAKTKAFKDKNIFPLAVDDGSVDENLNKIQTSERQSFFQRILTRKNLSLVPDKESQSSIFSPLETDKYITEVEQPAKGCIIC